MWKKISIYFFIILAFQQAYSQTDSLLAEQKFQVAPQFSYILKSNLLPMLWGPIPLTSEFRLVYETAVGHRSSLQLTASYLAKSPFLTIIETSDSTLQNEPPMVVYGYKVGVAYKIYLRNAMRGWYMAPVFNWSQAFFTTDFLRNHDAYLMARYVNYGLVVGYQLVDNARMAIDIYTGLGVRNNVMIEHSPGYTQTIEDFDMYLTKAPIKFYLGMNYGFTFR